MKRKERKKKKKIRVSFLEKCLLNLKTIEALTLIFHAVIGDEYYLQGVL